MTDYEYDIFISYRHMDNEWIRWTRENFLRPLRSLLQPGLGAIRVFIDEAIETGSSWPDYIARAHSRSRVLIPVLSRDYFNSDWCLLELALMVQREKRLGYRTPARPHGLILPFIIDDGDSFPAEVQSMQGEKIHDFAWPCMCTDGAHQERFAYFLRKCCPSIEKALLLAPPYDPGWEQMAHDLFKETFRIKIGEQKTLPSLRLHHESDPEEE